VHAAAEAAPLELLHLDQVLPAHVRVAEDEHVFKFTWVSVQVKFADPDSNADVGVALPS
jgi:hypothetical protein